MTNGARETAMIGRFIKGLRFLLVAAAVFFLPACAPKEKEPIQIGPVIAWQELSTGAVAPAMNGHRLVLQGTDMECRVHQRGR